MVVENEQQTKKKKTGKIRRIFKWLGLGVLALLVILAFVFQAPWKVISLLAIVFLACTILPKRYRKWFWLSTAGVVAVLIIWIFLPENDEGWRPYTFDTELTALKAKYTIPDEENAAVIYIELLELLDIDSNQPDFFRKTTPSSTTEFWLTKDHPETAEWLRGYQGTMGKIIQSAAKEKCFFPIAMDSINNRENIKQVSNVRYMTLLLVSAANNDIAEGRINAGIKKYICVLQMANHLSLQPVLAYHQMSVIEAFSFRQINRLIIEKQLSKEQLQLICDSIKNLKNNWGSDLLNLLDYEKLYARNMLCGMVYEKNSQGKIRLSRHRLFVNEQSHLQNQEGTYSRRRLAKLGVVFAWFYMPSSPQKIGEIVNDCYKKYYDLAEPSFDWNTEPDRMRPRWNASYKAMVEMMTSLPYPAYFQIHETYIKYLSLRRGSRLLVAIKQYHNENGDWPESLAAIKSAAPAEAFIDPVTGNQLQYENHGERFSLYTEAINIWPR